MKRLIIAALALLVLAGAAEAKILVVVGNTTASLITADGKYVMNVWARWQKVLGLEYDTYDANYIKVVGTDTTDILDVASSGDYSMAILLNIPNLNSGSFNGDPITEFNTNGWGRGNSHLGTWIDRGSAFKFPIPLFIPIPNAMANSGRFATAYTGQLTPVNRTWTDTHDRILTDAQGDSIYISVQPTNISESFAVGQDSLSFVRLLLWRDDEATWDALDAKPAYAWMTVGTGSHKVIYLPFAAQHFVSFMWPTIIGMFEKITPVDVPIIAGNFGTAATAYWGTSKDTTSLGANFAAIKDYAVANGMKIDLDAFTYSMKNETGADAHAVFQTTAYSYSNSYPNNIRITPSTNESWSSTQYDWFGATNATTYNGVDGMANRIATTQTGLAANFPTASLTRASAYSGYFQAATTYTKQDSVLMVLAAKGITDVYNLGDGSYAAMPPGDLTHSMVGAQRTWIGRGVSTAELRFHPYSSLHRYILQQTNDDYGDTLRISYINTAQYKDNRADFMRYYIPTACGYFRTTGAQAIGSQGISITTAATTHLATHGAGYQPGVHLNALTFTGGSILNPNHATKKFTMAGADSSRSLFLDVMKQINNQVKMANYISSTYGSTGQPIFVYSWMEDVNHDRRLGRTYSNNHVSR